ncbi:MAG TPA: hypothetical protein VJ865_09460 [Gemmatimonadaceae bacterium]|nr:hypothetical protein [Gemmatimonadaceae bacterium]
MPRNDKLGKALADAVDALAAEKLRKITNDMIDTLSSPAFVAAMTQLKKTPMDKRLAVASKTLTPTALAAAGVKLPPGMRVTSRYFEQGSPADIIEVTDHGAALRHVSSIPPLGGGAAVGAWGCACGGGATVCGGAGGGS